MSELELVPTGDLIDELLSRCDYGIVSVVKVKSQDEDGEDDTYFANRQWSGNAHHCMGVAFDMGMVIREHLEGNIDQRYGPDDELE